MHHRINSPSVISESLDGEVVVIHLGTGTYYSLQGTAARMWDAVAAGLTTDEVAADAAAAFDADGRGRSRRGRGSSSSTSPPRACSSPASAPPSPRPSPMRRRGSPWQRPVLETFTDMQDLILLDPVHEVEPARGWPAARGTSDG